MTEPDIYAYLPQGPDVATFPVYGYDEKGAPYLPKGWRKCPPANRDKGEAGVALPTGSKYGIVVIDLDRKDGKDAVAWWTAQEATHNDGEPLDTFTVRTPSGGLHLYFQCLPGDPEPTTSGTIAPGLDTRGEGGFVYGPGTIYKDPARGTYQVENDAPPMPMPPWVRELLLGASASIPDSSNVDARAPLGTAKTVEDLRDAVKGHRSPYAAFWRDVCRGVEPIKDRADGGWNDYLARATTYLAGLDDWCEVTGETLLQIMGPSLSHMHARRVAEGKDLAHLDRDSIASLYDRAAEKARMEADALKMLADFWRDMSAEVSNRGPQASKILQFRRSYYLAQEPQGFVGPFLREEVLAQAKARGAFPTTVPTEKGPRKLLVDEAMESVGAPLDNVIQDLNLERALLEPSTMGGYTLIVPACQRLPVDPKESEAVHAWLWALGGDPLLDWIATARELDVAAPALWISGGSGTGKSLLARGLAALWGRTPTPMASALSRFNDVIAECPVVFADEDLPRTQRGFTDVEGLKRLVADTRRMVEPKGLPQVELRGAVRVIIATNNMDGIRASKDLTAEDAQALCDRLIHLRCDGHPAEVIATYLSRVPVQKEWLDGGALASHLEWIIQTREVPEHSGRFRLPSNAGDLRGLLLTSAGAASFYVCRVLAEWLLRAAKAVENNGGQLPQSPGITWHQGRVLATASGIKAQLDSDHNAIRHQAQFGATLKRMAGSSERVSMRTSDGPRSLWPIPLARLLDWAQAEGWMDPKDLRTAAGVLDNATGG